MTVNISEIKRFFELPFFEEQVKQEYSDNSHLIYEENYIRWQKKFIFVIIVL